MDNNGKAETSAEIHQGLSPPSQNIISSSGDSLENQANVRECKEQDDIHDPKKKSRNRKRKKGLHNLIRAQMEFYFSDANLSKDRFMQNAVKDGPEVPLNIFLGFNRVRNITEDIQEVQKALEHSNILKLNDDKSKVSRIVPFKPRSQEEEDLCTVYVEHLPISANIDWVSGVFKEFGEVAYVSLPKYKDGRTKGFAFVEFVQPSSAVEAVKAYSATSAYESLIQDPGQLCSIKAFNEKQEEAMNEGGFETKDLINIKEEIKEAEDYNEQKKKNCTDANAHGDANKENEDEEPKPKRPKLEQCEETAESSAEISAENANIQLDEKQNETLAAPKKSKKKKKKKVFQHDDAALNYEAQTLPLQVMSKKEWKKLRNKYLNMQRKCVRQLRTNAFRQHSYHEHDYKYEESHEDLRELHENTEIKVEHGIEFDTGLIVKITLDEPIADAKRFKGQVRSQDGVSYVEAQDGSNFAYVRCHDSAAAKSLVQKNIWHQTCILEGDEEKDYWQKIEDNRTKKRDKSAKQRKPGNRGKKDSADGDILSLPSKAAQHKSLHIRFDDETNEGGT